MELNKFIRDVVHGDIVLENKWVSELINSPEMNRLRKIKQLGSSYYAFPCATHNRFSHSLGTFYVVRSILQQIKHQLTKTQINEILVAALLHDVGHGPHSHAFEIYANFDHETMTQQIILDPHTKLHQILQKYSIQPQNVVKILTHNYPIKWVNDLISSQIDADRLDYLARDSYFTGACYGTIDIDLIIQWALLKNDQICFHDKAISSIENFLLARYHMYYDIYEKPKTTAYCYLIKKILAYYKAKYQKKFPWKNQYNLEKFYQSWLNDQLWDNENFLKIDDYNLEMFLQQIAQEDDQFLQDAFQELSTFGLRNYEVIENTPKNKTNILQQLKKKYAYPELYFHEITIHAKSLYNNQKQPIWIYESHQDQVVELSKISKIIHHLLKMENKSKFIVFRKD